LKINHQSPDSRLSKVYPQERSRTHRPSSVS